MWDFLSCLLVNKKSIIFFFQRKLRSVQKSVEPNAAPVQQASIDEKQEDEPIRGNSQPSETIAIEVETKTPQAITQTVSDAFQGTKDSPIAPDPTFPVEFEDNFDFKPSETKEVTETEVPTERVKEKPKFTEKELKVLQLQLENAEYLQLKSLLQAKINSEQFEIVKLRSHVALKNKQEGNIQTSKENKENYTPEEQELRQKLIKENAILEQKRLNLVNQIFQERVACIQLKIELAMKEIMSKS